MLQKRQDTLGVLITGFIPSYRIALFLFAATFFLPGCKDEPPTLNGANETFTTSGTADDGDDVTTPPPGGASYVNPARTASDGPAKAVSDTGSYRALNGSATAQIGVQANRPSSAQSLNSVSSTFVVTKAVTLKFRIESTAVTVLEKGIANYGVRAVILDNARQTIVASFFRKRYDFKENLNGKNDVAEDGRQFTQVADGDFFNPADIGPSTAFTLQPGNYTLLFQLDIAASADRQIQIEIQGVPKAEIRVSATVDLIVP
jgi:hypothetical protein